MGSLKVLPRIGLASLLVGLVACSALGAAPPLKKAPPARKVVISASAPKAARAAAVKPAAPAAAAQSAAKFLVLTDTFPSAATESAVKAQGVEPYFDFYQDNFDPQAKNTGLIDADKLVAAIRAQLGNDPKGWGMLDYEVPFDDNFAKGPGNPDYEKSVASMVAAIKRVKAEFPNVKWTYYGIPALRSWLETPTGPRSFANCTPEQQQVEIDRQLAAHAPVLREVDWVMVCIYDRQEKAKIEPQKKDLISSLEYGHKLAKVKMCKSFYAKEHLPDRPVLPAVNLYYAPGGNTIANRLIPLDEVANEQIRAALEGGAEGIAFWTGADYYFKEATKPDYPESNSLYRTQQLRVRGAAQDAYLNGIAPTNWSSEALRRSLLDHAGNTLRDAAKKANEMGAARATPAPKTPNGLAGAQSK